MARKALIHKHTNQTTTSGGVLSPKLPTVGTLEKGEIAVNYKNGYETLSIENDAGEVIPFASLEQTMAYTDASIVNADWNATSGKAQILNKPDIPDEKLSSSYQTSTLENDNLLLAGGDTYETAFSKIEKAILDNEETIAASLNDLNTKKIEIDDVPTKTSQLTNDSNFTTLSEVTQTIVNSAPTTLDTLKELADALGNDANFATTVTTQIGNKADRSNITAGTYRSVTVNNQGIVTGGTNPTTLAGYGITDAAPAVAGGYLPLSGGTMAGPISFSNNNALPSKSLSYIVGIDAFADGGQMGWQYKSNFLADTLNTSSTAQTKAGNLTATKFITKNGTSSQFVKGDGSLDSNTYMSQKLLESRGENLIYNGNGFMGDNTNFPKFVFDQTECNGSNGSFKKTSYAQATCTYSIPVNPSLTYMFRIDGKQSEQTKPFYALLNCYDIDGYEILPEHYYWKEAEKTELTQDLVAGDTVIYLANISDEWLTTGGTVINFWNYTNSKGYTFPPYTYTRNSLNYGSYDAIDRVTNTITLSVPYSGKTIPVGTKVSRKRYGGTYLYLWSGMFGSDWTTKTSILGGINTSGWADIQNGKCVFRPGTSFVKLGFLVNWSGANTQTTWITNISFSANDAGMSLPLIGGTLTGSIEATSFKKTGGTSSQFLKADGSVDSNTYLTSHQQLKTINNESIVGTGNLAVSGLPTVTSSDNGKILQVVNGAWALVTPTVT